jgi:hypothetical protein
MGCNNNQEAIQQQYYIHYLLKENIKKIIQFNREKYDQIRGNGKTYPHSQPVSETANSIQVASKQLLKDIYALKDSIAKFSSGYYTEKEAEALQQPHWVKQIKNPKMTAEAAAFLLNTNDVVTTIPQQIANFRATLIKQLESLWKKNLPITFFRDQNKKDSVLNALQNQFRLPTLNDNWANNTFTHQNALTATIALSNLEHDIVSTVHICFDFLLPHTKKHPIDYNQYDIAIHPEKSIIKLGETYKASIYPIQKIPLDSTTIVVVAGDTLSIQDGVAPLTIRPTRLGEYVIPIEIHLMNKWTGEMDTWETERHYEVIPLLK